MSRFLHIVKTIGRTFVCRILNWAVEIIVFRVYHSRDMKVADDIVKKYSLEEVALLVIFALGLLLALVIVIRRSRINMSDPIELPYSGLSVSVPAGRGWRSSDSWVYKRGNEFMVAAYLEVGGRSIAVVRCSYMMAAERIPAGELLEKHVAALRMRIVHSGQILANDIVIEWAQLDRPRRSPDYFLGIAQLPSGKTLAIDVHAPNDQLLAAKLFKMTAKSVVFESDELLEKGNDFVGRIKSEGIGGIIAKYSDFDKEIAYLISDAVDRANGFQLKTFTKNPDRSDWAAQKIKSVQNLAGSKGGLTATVCDCSDKLDRFIWQTLRPGAGNTEIELSRDGRMRVSSRKTGDVTYWPGAGAVPEICLDVIGASFLDSYAVEAVIDVIRPNGQIVPSLVSSIDASQDRGNRWGAPYAVRIEFLDGRGARLRMYFDFKKRPVGKVAKDGQTLVWHSTDRQSLTEEFGNLERYLGHGPVLK